MPTEYFNDAELDTMSKALTLIARELEQLSGQVHDFTKQRMAKRLASIQEDIGTVLKTLPSGGILMVWRPGMVPDPHEGSTSCKTPAPNSRT